MHKHNLETGTDSGRSNKKPGKKMRKWHKWAGLIFSFFFILFALSGIFLNHRKGISSLDIPRSVLPSDFRYNNWNNAAIKGTLKLSPDSILMYGGSGLFLADSTASIITPYQDGMKNGADNRITGSIVKTESGEIFAISTFDLYKLDMAQERWINISPALETDERLSDMQAKGDSLIVLSRSHLFLATYPYRQFHKIELESPEGYKKEASLFRTVWTLHSGELFGIPGKLFVDFLGIVSIVICLTGILITFFPKLIRHRKRKQKETRSASNMLKKSFHLHNKLGASLLLFLAVLVTSGAFLRPPLLIAIVRSKVPTIPGTHLNNDNPWFDKLRCIRYDKTDKEWILYTSDGFYRFAGLNETPQKLLSPPPISVMGVNVLEEKEEGIWLVGSFSGLYYWHKGMGKSLDAYTLKPATVRRGGPPTFTNAVSGYSGDFATGEIAFDYSSGARRLVPGIPFPEMPRQIKNNSRMSAWHLCLEIHTGRIYSPIIGIFSDLFVFLSGLISLSILISGYIIYRRRHKKKPPRQTL